MPHLPLEWAAVARALAFYADHPSKAPRFPTLAAPLTAWASLLVIAALAESYLTAHTAAVLG